MDPKLSNLGFAERFLQEATLYPNLYIGRVVAQYRGNYKVATAKAELRAEISGQLRHVSDALPDYPAVGDFVMLDREDEAQGKAIIHHILTRKSVFARQAAGTAHDVQVVAANIDAVFICMSLNNDFNLRRLERYLAISWASGATPVVVLTKADLCEDLPAKRAAVEQIAVGVDVLVTSSLTEDGYEAVLRYIAPGRTVALLGSSGVGKSTLINRLLGESVIKTRETRSDGKGRHTTTRRELLVLPSGGAVIDTPGMRELGVESVDLAKTFTDIEELARQCRFKDCRHESEPGCAVRQAIAEGLISEERLQSHRKLEKQAKYEGLDSRGIEQVKIDAMYSKFGSLKNVRDYLEAKNKNR